MDKIKILAAVLALAGCMENGMGMEENEINGGKIIIRSLEPNKVNRLLQNIATQEKQAVTFDGIDFNGDIRNIPSINSIVLDAKSVIFNECKAIPCHMPSLIFTEHINFINCVDSLGIVSDIVRINCSFDYLKTFVYTNTNETKLTKDFRYEYVIKFFDNTTFSVSTSTN